MTSQFTQTDLIDLDKIIKEYEENKKTLDKIRDNKRKNMKNYYDKNKEKIIANQSTYNKKKNEEYKILKNSQIEINN